MLLAGALLALAGGAEAQAQVAAPAVKKDVPYVPTPPEVVQVMLEMAGVKAGDVVYDLGCGDGRIVIAAVKIKGVRGVCVDIDPERIHESRQNAQIAQVARRIKFVQGDLFQVPIADASVVMMYLLPAVNLKLRPRLLSELRPGTRVVSHMFSMGDWEPERRTSVHTQEYEHLVYRWTIPRRAARGR
jgi:ubiquinone/menaquinone biosynthesis C-methylase UbiE